MPVNPTLRVGQVAEALHLSCRTVTKLIDAGELQGHRIPGGNQRRVMLADLAAFVAEKQMPPEFLTAAETIAGVSRGPLA